MTTTLIRNTSQVVTMASGGRPKRGRALADPGVIERGEVLVRDGQIVAVGPDAGRGIAADRSINAEGGVVLPGFVDPHTHLVFAGSRPAEWEARLVQGRSFADFIKTGGGAMDTVRATRAAPDDELEELILLRLARMASWGVTTAEVKSGYGLSVAEELRHLRVLQRAGTRSPIRVVPTALPAHFPPLDPGTTKAAYLDEIVESMVPAVADGGLATTFDIFRDEAAYDDADVRRLAEACRAAGLGIRLHADQLGDDGGAALAVEVGALSADHLGHISPAGVAAMAASDTIAVLIPGSLFFVPGEKAAPTRDLIDAGVAIAISTDYTPGTSPIASMPLAIALACVLLRISVAEAIAGATINAAFAVGLGDLVGSLEPGKQADLQVIEARDYREVPYRFGENLVRRVMVAGETVLERGQVGPL
ncbi:MAG: imidazolonepropionase [Chloroflexi bacterium]|nr:imidazolonepropionase [Chloroflexota bacterium]